MSVSITRDEDGGFVVETLDSTAQHIHFETFGQALAEIIDNRKKYGMED